MNSDRYLIAVVGPTAIGKTAAAITLAQHYDTEIISADSRQFYREMSIGTAKPTADELAQAIHHFVDSHSINQLFNVGDLEVQGLSKLEKIFGEHEVAIMAGGSGLYVNAITKGFDDLPQIDSDVRKELNSLYTEQGIGTLQQELSVADPEYYAQVDVNNPQRLIRALEVYRSTGKPFSSYRTGSSKQRPFKTIMIGLELPREQLYERINHRVDLMMQAGLLEEVRSLLPYRHLNALNTVGYSELFNHLDGLTDLTTAVGLIKQNTRRFAKRQLTWFKRDRDTQWFAPTNIPAIIDHIDKVIRQHHSNA